MTRAFSKIWIVVILTVVLAVVFFAWQKDLFRNYKNIFLGSQESPSPSPSQPSSQTTPDSKTETSQELTLESLKNGRYDFVDWRGFDLVNGEYNNDTFKIFARFYEDKMALGDIDQDGVKEAAVVISINGGGSGSFRYLTIMKNKNGAPQFFTSAMLGDRVIIKNLSIDSGIITVDMVVQGSNDAMCCPTLDKTARYKFIDNQLVEIP